MDNNNCCNCSNCEKDCGLHSNYSVQNTVSSNNGISTSTGDSRAIRIGNDIKLDVTIQELNGMDIINIKAIKCFIINTTPRLGDHCGNMYEIHQCGLPTYNIRPYHNMYTHYEYPGFGMYPFCGKNWHHNLMPHHDYFYHNPYGEHYLKCVNPIPKPFLFAAPVKALPDRNKVRVFFPASAQLLCGLYSLTFVIDLYEPGYHCNNLRTITVDYNNVFELVPNMEGAAGDITIDIDKQIGLNTLDTTMFGNVYNTNVQNLEVIESISITPDRDVRVGDVTEFIAECTSGSCKNITWTLSGDKDYAVLSSTRSNSAQIYGLKISNIVEGYNEVLLLAHSTDGGTAFGSKYVKIHNYATDINFGSYGDTIILPYKGSKTSTIYVTQEDGTKLSICEIGDCNCQAIEVGSLSLIADQPACVDIVSHKVDYNIADSNWDYDDENTIGYDSADDFCNAVVSKNGCCKSTRVSLYNLNNTDDTVITKIRLTSRLKDKDGLFIQKDITVICFGKNGFNPNGGGNTGGEDDEEFIQNDRYITGASYNQGNNEITFSMQGMDPIVANVSNFVNYSDYWYEGNL